MAKLKEMMGHIDYFYQPIPSAYDDTIEFTVYLKDGRWEIKNNSVLQTFGTTSSDAALDFLIEVKADLKMLHNLIYSNICTEGVLRRMQLKKCEAIVGTENIDNHEEAWTKFSESLVGMIEGIADKKEEKKTGLTLVEE